MSLLVLNSNSQKARERLVRNAGGVLYLDARKATGGGLPSNSPLTSPWKDLLPYVNDATPHNFAGTLSSGVDTTDINKPWWVLDGTDDYFSLIDKASLDITSGPLAIFMTIKTPAVLPSNNYLVGKNISAAADMQYGMYYVSTGSFIVFLEAAARRTVPAGYLQPDTVYNIGFIWTGTKVRVYKNLVFEGTEGSYSGSLTNRPNARIGCRSASADGNTNLYFHNGKIATVTIYTGSKATESNILKAERAISKAYIG